MGTTSKYKTLREIGSGPIGDVLLCREVDGLGREVAVKRWRSDSRSQRSRREAFFQANQTWSRLAGDGLVTLYSLDQSEDAIVYEFHRASADQVLGTGGQSVAEVQRWMSQTFAGLKRLHEGGVLHFNLKPSNVLLTSGGSARLIDGACIPWSGQRELPRPTARQKYLAPEMIEPALGPIGEGTDIYCLAFVMLELMIGPEFDSLFVGGDSGAIDVERNWLRWHADTETPLPPLDRFKDRLPAELIRVFERALVKKPAQRYHQCGELLADLASVSMAPSAPAQPAATATTRPPSPAPTAPKPAAQEIGVEAIPKKPPAPIVLRCFGCEADMIGVNTDNFTVGGAGNDFTLPKSLLSSPTAALRLTRGAEGWRVSMLDGPGFYLNQTFVDKYSSLRSGDAVRFTAGGPGFQFTILHRNSESLASLTARYAPRLMGVGSGGRTAGAAPAAAPKRPGPPTPPGQAAPPTAKPPKPSRPAAKAPPQPTGWSAEPGSPKPVSHAPAKPNAPTRPAPAAGKLDDGTPSTLQRWMDYKSWDKSTKNWATLFFGVIAMAALISMLPTDEPTPEPTETQAGAAGEAPAVTEILADEEGVVGGTPAAAATDVAAPATPSDEDDPNG